MMALAEADGQREPNKHDADVCSGNTSCNSFLRTFTARSSVLVAGGIIAIIFVLVASTTLATTLIDRSEDSAVQPTAMMTAQTSGGFYRGNCILVDRETRLVDSYKEETAFFKNQSDGNCFVSVAGKLVIHLEGRDCDKAATAQCVAYPYADWCAHEEYKPFCLPQNECTNPFEFDASLLSPRVSLEKCDNGILTFVSNGTYSNDAPLIKNIVDGYFVIDASGTVTAIQYLDKNKERRPNDDPNTVYGKDVSLVTLSNVMCDEAKTSTYVCENLTEWQDELVTWLPWEYPCWIYGELGIGQIVTTVQVEELCACRKGC